MSRRVTGVPACCARSCSSRGGRCRLPVVGRPVPVRRPELAAAGAVPAGDHQGGRRRPVRRSSSSRRRPPPTRSTSSGRTSPSSGRSPRSSSRWAPSPAETDRGTAAFVLSKTASRGGVPRREGRWRSRPSWASARSWPWSVGWIYTAILFEPPPVAGWIGLGVLAWLGLGAWAAITFLGSTVTGSTAAAAGIGFVALLVLSIVAAIPSVAPVTPGGLAGAGDRAGDRARRSRLGDVLRPGRLDRGPDRARPRRSPPGRSAGRSCRAARTTPGGQTDRPRRRAEGRDLRRRRSRARRGSRRCPAPSSGGGVRIEAGVADSSNGTPTWRMTPHAGCSSSTVIPRAAASGDANAATMSLIGPHGISAASSAASHSVARSARGTARRGSGAARPGARRGRRSSRSADRPPARAGRAPTTEPRPLPLGADRDRDRRRRRSRTSRTGRCSGARCRAGPGATPVTNAFWAWLTRLARVDAEQRDVDALAARQDRVAGEVRAPAPRVAARQQRRQDADRPEHPGHDVADRDARPWSAAAVRVGRAGDRHQPARRLDDEVVAGPVGRRARRCRSR